MAKTKQYTEEFKKQIVQLCNWGKSNSEIISEYGMAKSTLNKWVKDYGRTRSFTPKDNRSVEENQLIKLNKELK
ncbi:MAG: transposase [Christensenellaceae bacterium]